MKPLRLARIIRDCTNEALKETRPMQNELNLPSLLNNDVDAFSVSATIIREELHVGRPFGGIFFIWKENISKFVSFRTYNDPRILGLSLSLKQNLLSC